MYQKYKQNSFCSKLSESILSNNVMHLGQQEFTLAFQYVPCAVNIPVLNLRTGIFPVNLSK